MSRKSNTLERKNQIVEGLKIVMAEKGYEGATTADIARAANLAPGLVHYHFGSKQAILVALVERLAAQLKERLELRLSQAGRDLWAQMDAYIAVHLARGEDADPRALACWVQAGAEAIRQKEVAVVYKRALIRDEARLRGILRAILREESSEYRLKSLTSAIYAAIQGYFTLSAIVPSLIPAGTAEGAVRAMARALVAGKTA